MTESFSNNATPKYLGYVYQVLIAIEQCFQAKDNETIWIECYGDVYDGNTSIEVKHHFENTNLTSNSVDFWKTLKNLVIEDVGDFNSIILHTTENIKDDSIFYGWNELSNVKKYDRLKKHTPTDTIRSYYDASITNYPKKDLLPILEKLNIKHSQLNIKEKLEELKNAKIFTLINQEHRDDAFHWVYGYVNKQAIIDRKNWKIKVNDFNKAFRFGLQSYIQNNTPFPYVDEPEITDDSNGFLFVEEMKNIKLRKSPIQKAICDYLRANNTQIAFLKNQPAISELLDRYDNSILHEIKSLKDKHSANIEEHELNTEKAFKTAIDFYFDSIRLPLISIPDVDRTEKYYQDGRVHHNVNEGKFVWCICEDDIS